MKSKEFRESANFLRNEFPVSLKYGLPIIKAQKLPKIDELLSYHDIREADILAQKISYLVHFFKDDYRFESLYRKAYSKQTMCNLYKLAQYSGVLTPDFSVYPEMPFAEQLHQTFKNRWCGAYLQHMGLNVYPTISWSDRNSLDFCFEGIEKNSVVAISTVGLNRIAIEKKEFLYCYERMLEVLEPSIIICYGIKLPEMKGKIVNFKYQTFRKAG